MRTRSMLLAGLAILASAGATTLQQLSLDDMIQQSTGIVRAKVTGSRSALRGQNIYTYYRLHVLEAAKANPAPGQNNLGNDIEVAVPGGSVNGVRQVAIGAPELNAGAEYVVFLWTGKSGLTQIIGLSQGLFLAVRDAAGNINLTRPATDAVAGELTVDRNGRPVSAELPAAADSKILRWSELRARIGRELGHAGAGK
jgi:hypothetical protein